MSRSPREPSQDLTAPMPVPARIADPAAAEGGVHQGGSVGHGRYTFGAILGAGGMGVVRRAWDRVLARDVAVKWLADNLAADHIARERFLREARAAARIVHPNVVAVYDVASEGDRPYLVMELVDGPSLAQVLASRGPLLISEVVDVAVDALSGLERAHHAGLLHRDVKPANLLRGRDGTVKVTDFGVAEAADVPGLTRTGTVVGTGAYLAPERRRGEPATVQSDLYALGATLAELATGEPPEADAPPVLPAHAPRGLRRLLVALLSSDPRRRPADAAESLSILAGERRSPRAADPGPATRSRRTTRPMAARTLEPRTAAARRGRAHVRKRIVAATLAAVVAGAGVVAASSRVAEPADEAAEPAVDGASGQVGENPAATVEQLAEWLRDQAGR